MLFGEKQNKNFEFFFLKNISAYVQSPKRPRKLGKGQENVYQMTMTFRQI